jgi:hypothetical protein
MILAVHPIPATGASVYGLPFVIHFHSVETGDWIDGAVHVRRRTHRQAIYILSRGERYRLPENSPRLPVECYPIMHSKNLNLEIAFA